MKIAGALVPRKTQRHLYHLFGKGKPYFFQNGKGCLVRNRRLLIFGAVFRNDVVPVVQMPLAQDVGGRYVVRAETDLIVTSTLYFFSFLIVFSVIMVHLSFTFPYEAFAKRLNMSFITQNPNKNPKIGRAHV